jgi:hypothetical protein
VRWQLLSTHAVDTARIDDVGRLFIAAGGTFSFAKYEISSFLRELFDGFFGTVPFSAEYLILATDIF